MSSFSSHASPYPPPFLVPSHSEPLQGLQHGSALFSQIPFSTCTFLLGAKIVTTPPSIDASSSPARPVESPSSTASSSHHLSHSPALPFSAFTSPPQSDPCCLVPGSWQHPSSHSLFKLLCISLLQSVLHPVATQG